MICCSLVFITCVCLSTLASSLVLLPVAVHVKTDGAELACFAQDCARDFAVTSGGKG